VYRFVSNQLKDILALKSEKHFYFSLLLSIKFFFMSATISTYLYISMMADVSWGGFLADSSTYIWAVAAVTLFIFVGKQVILMHMKIFTMIDNQFQKLINWYSLRYYKKHKKDAPLLTNISKYSMKMFGWWTKLTPKRRKLLLITVMVCYGAYFIGIQFVDDLAHWIDVVYPEV
jgi:hypothetical protein